MEISTISTAKRCAIYTRKSADPPVGQEVTSLESQRTICNSYIASQQHKGWASIARHYDDPGRSGSSLERPALQDLLADIDAGHIDIVVVYKIDRITRTLLDFVRLMDFFEKYGVAFVAITQNFDTSDSMGRLIRNVLLTFAQFEREIASDRMRDKKMVMSQRGLWTGGNPPLGYDLRKGKLVVNPHEAAAVRCIFETYVETSRISAVHKRLAAEGYRRKKWKSATGGLHGGGKIGLSSLHHILRNAAYVGDAVYRGERYPGIHQPLIEVDLWERAQQVLKEREQFKPRRSDHILTGILFDAHGRRMHARLFNPMRSARYYMSAPASWAKRQGIPQVTLKADPLERIVLEALKTLLADRARIRPLLMRVGILGLQLDTLSEQCGAAAVRIDQIGVSRCAEVMKALFQRIEVGSDCIRLIVRPDVVAHFLGWNGMGLFKPTALETVEPIAAHVIEVPVAATRGRRRSWLPIEPRRKAAQPCPRLVSLLDDARAAYELIFANRAASVAELAKSQGRKTASFSRLVRLQYLAPDIVAAIRDGTQPLTLTRRALIECDLPMDWNLQRRLLGFETKRKMQRTEGGAPRSDITASSSA